MEMKQQDNAQDSVADSGREMGRTRTRVGEGDGKANWVMTVGKVEDQFECEFDAGAKAS